MPRSRRVVATLAAWFAASAIGAGGAHAQFLDSLVVRGLQDLEVYKTDAESLLLSKNEGKAAGLGRLQLWAGANFGAGFEGAVVYEAYGGKANDEEGIEAGIQQVFLRYVAPGKTRLLVDVGRIVNPIGNFSRRYQSTVNPLIGGPHSYTVDYPDGAVVMGKASLFDYRLAVIDRPLAHEDWVPDSSPAYRPAVELGVTPTIGLRIGGYFTQGPYLGQSSASMIPTGQSWRSYEQQIAGMDLEFSRGYFELNADLAFSAYDVPTQGAIAHGRTWYVEPKYTFTPRFFAAMRLEYNDYPYIAPIDSTLWVAQNAAFYDLEVGVGWRFTPELLLKASYSCDHWMTDPATAEYFPNGHAYAMQLSYGFDIRSWFEPKK